MIKQQGTRKKEPLFFGFDILLKYVINWIINRSRLKEKVVTRSLVS